MIRWPIFRYAGLAASLPLLLQVSLAQPRAGKDSFVKVLVSSPVGVFDEGSMLQIIQVQQRIPFPGLLIDDKGHIVSFVGMRWPELRFPDVQIMVETANGERYRAEVVGIDQRISLAVLVAGIPNGFPAQFAEFPEKGQLRFFNLGRQEWRISAPFLLNVKTTPLLPERDVQVAGLGESQQGWSNSIVLNTEDKVVGIAIRTKPYPYSKTVEVCEIIPAGVIHESADRIMRTRTDIRAGWLGVLAREFKDKQAIIERTIRGGPAEKAGLRSGDAIIRVQDQPVENWQRLADTIRWRGAGNELPLTIKRGDTVRKIAVRLSHRMDTLPRMQWMITTEERVTAEGRRRTPRISPVLPPLSFLGFEVDPLSAQLAEYFNCPEGRGLLVRQVMPDSAAQKAGLRAGDVLIRVNDVAVSSPAELHRTLRTKSEIDIQVMRDRQIRTIKLILP
ncbi:MAG TPA: PDZ domain-containing protein [Acidobacteriota bacterium]|nr:PDZ domain-containing protein [Acidobacteriota bacterium]